MFKLGTIKISKQVNSNKNLLISNNNISINNYHSTNRMEAKLLTLHDFNTIGKITKVLGSSNKNDYVILNKKKSEDIIKQVLYTYKTALKHYSFHDIISSNEVEDTVTIAFLPISTSSKKISCGIQKFDKILTYSNGFINIYTTRLLFHKTMTKTEYEH
jgi:hypothetical protein